MFGTALQRRGIQERLHDLLHQQAVRPHVCPGVGNTPHGMCIPLVSFIISKPFHQCRMRVYNPQSFLYLKIPCRDDGSELK